MNIVHSSSSKQVVGKNNMKLDLIDARIASLNDEMQLLQREVVDIMKKVKCNGNELKKKLEVLGGYMEVKVKDNNVDIDIVKDLGGNWIIYIYINKNTLHHGIQKPTPTTWASN